MWIFGEIFGALFVEIVAATAGEAANALKGLTGPPSVFGSACPECGAAGAMQEARRRHLGQNLNFHVDNYLVTYRCKRCGHQMQQKEIR